MKELILKELQSFGLKIMKEIDRWCVEHDVNYTLCGGSLIGAIRHKGFIPWDDDIDIVMTRPNYQKFVHEFSHDDLVCIAPELGNSYLTFARIADTKTTVSYPYCPWCKTEGVGLYVDIFPLDGEPESKEDFDKLMAILKNKESQMYQIRGTLMPWTKDLGIVRTLKWLGKQILYGRYNYEKELSDYIKIMKSIPYEGSEYCGNLACPVAGLRERQRSEIFEEYIRISFEDCELSVVKNYDEYLSDIFGDYMKLPSEKDRVPKHSEHKFYYR